MSSITAKRADEVQEGDIYLFTNAEGEVESSFLVWEVTLGDLGVSIIGPNPCFACLPRGDTVLVA